MLSLFIRKLEFEEAKWFALMIQLENGRAEIWTQETEFQNLFF